MTQSAQYGEQWSHIRDFQNRGVSKDDARELLHITQIEFQPPSKAHVKRVLKVRPNVVLKPRVVDKAPDPVHVYHNRLTARAMSCVAILRPNFVALKTGTHQRTGPRRPFVPQPERVVIAGLLPNYHVPPVERLEPDYRVARRLHETLATVYGPLTRQQQAEVAFTLALYGDIIYAG